GYNFLGEKVYNPFDILLFLNRKDFKNYWCETGNPTFLIDLIQKNQYNPISIEKIEVSEEDMGSFDVDHIQLEVLLFQTGYLTILKKERIGVRTIYKLTYPNLEVRSSLNSVILMHLSNDSQNAKIESKLYKILQSGDPSLMKPIFHSFFASIPHDWYRKNKLANYEAYYASIFYCYFASLGLDVRAEDVTNHGQVDMTVFFENKVFVFEFKVIELTEKGSALSQIKQKRYYEKHLNVDRNGDSITVETRHALSLQNPSSLQIQKREIYLIGVEFSREDRNITNLEWEKI
ncbi:MAG: PD-(D/E)XK nuclease domain-containing protein, partial [Leptospiraceae bacterium]|nr:PD-(D/E)XK nuclease domain-containing protein [Leptospiraceae bacterium]